MDNLSYFWNAHPQILGVKKTIDFIDMKEDSDKTLLLEQLRRYAAQDPVKTTVVDITELNLVEMTRKKGKKPLWEQLIAVSGEKSTAFAHRGKA